MKTKTTIKLMILEIFLISLLALVGNASMTLRLQPLENDTLQINTSLNYTFILSDVEDCSNILLQEDVEITTDSRGNAMHYLDLSSLNQAFPTNFLCEYRNSTLKFTHNISDILFNTTQANTYYLTGQNGLVKLTAEDWCPFTFGYNTFGQSEPEGSIGTCFLVSESKIVSSVLGSVWQKIGSQGTEAPSFFANNGYYYFEPVGGIGNWIHQEAGYGDWMIEGSMMASWNTANYVLYVPATFTQDVELQSNAYLSTDANEYTATDIIRHNLTATDIINTYLTEEWNQADVEHIINIETALIVRNIDPYDNTTATYWSNDFIFGGLGQMSARYNGTTIRITTTYGNWIENDTVNINIQYEQP